MTIRGAIFDLDGVLADTQPLHSRSWLMLADDYDLPLVDAQVAAMAGRARGDALDILLAGRPVSAASRAQMLDRKQAHFLAALDHAGGAILAAGAHDALARARAQGLRVALASSSTNARHILVRGGIEAVFDAIVDGTEALPSKPDPTIFREAARRIGVAPRETVIFEDSDAGLRAARDAGAAVTVAVGPALEAATYRLPSLADPGFEAVMRAVGTVEPAA